MSSTSNAFADRVLSDAAKQLIRGFMEEGIPFNKFLGMKLGEIRPGFGRLELPPRDEFTGDPWRPALHGGVISTLADTVGGLACFTLMTQDDRCSTIDLRVDYLRPGKVNTGLVAEANIIRFGNRVAVANVVVFQDEDRGNPVAVAKGVYSIRRKPVESGKPPWGHDGEDGDDVKQSRD